LSAKFSTPFLAPLSWYWVDPCCRDPAHLTNYRSADFLPRLGAVTSVLKEYIRDSLYTRHTSNFRVLCPNRILGIAQRRAELPIEDARELAAMWGRDPVHPSGAAYQTIAEGIGKDALNPDAKYTNLPRSVSSQAGTKKPRLDLSLERDSWVRGCTAALPRKDSTYGPAGGSQQARGKWPRGRAWFRGAYPRGGEVEVAAADAATKCLNVPYLLIICIFFKFFTKTCALVRCRHIKKVTSSTLRYRVP
jgi:hypothetical protein